MHIMTSYVTSSAVFALPCLCVKVCYWRGCRVLVIMFRGSSKVNGLLPGKPPPLGSRVVTDDDPFADDDDITGEEWEFIASQAEGKFTKTQSVITQNISTAKTINGTSSFTAPAPKVSTTNGNTNVALVKELEEKLAFCEQKVKEFEQLYRLKDGETMVLRDRLATTEKNLNQEKMKVLEMQNVHEQAEAEREKKMQKEVEKFKDQVEFKQAEILESQNMIRNLEAKNKLLERHKPGPSASLSTERRAMDYEHTGTSDFNHTSAKRIKLVKPESPRISNASLLPPPDFTDDPLGRKTGVRDLALSPEKKNTTKCNAKPSIFARGFTLKSKYLSKDLSDRLTGQQLLQVKFSLESTKNEQTPPLLDLIDHAATPECIGAMNCLRNLIACQEDNRVFANMGGMMKDVNHDYEHLSSLLSLIEGSIASYVNLQDLLLNGVTSQETSSFHTAQSEICSERTVSSGRRCSPNLTKTCRSAHAALQVLDTLVTFSKGVSSFISDSNQALVFDVIKICNLEKWHPSLEGFDSITNLALGVILKLAESSKDSQLFRFSNFVKADILQPLLANRSVELKKNTLAILVALTKHSPFVSALVKEDTSSGSPSILCHICDLVCLDRPQDVIVDSWLRLAQKIVNFFSLLIARHEAILVEHSCFCEVYHAADILLYIQLTQWRKDSSPNLIRLELIKSTLCLLHSCTNIYPDGIPNSRRDHRHQLTLTSLEEFLLKEGDKSSFWSQELGRIVKSEVKVIFEEGETS